MSYDNNSIESISFIAYPLVNSIESIYFIAYPLVIKGIGIMVNYFFIEF